MPTTAAAIPPILTTLVGRLAEAVPRRGRTTFAELLLGAATTRGGHVTDAILAAGLSRSWTTYYWFLQRGRWAWLAVWRALLAALATLFEPAVWHVVIDDTVVERISAGAPGSLIHRNHSAKPNRPRFLRGQGWLCLAAVVERGWKVGAVPLMLRLVRRATQRGKLASARFLVRLLGRRLGRVRLLLDAWFMRARLIEAALADGHTVIGRARRDLAFYAVPRPPRRRRRGRPRKYGPRMTPERVAALPVHRSARVLYGRFEVARYRSCRVAARFLKGRVVRAVWVRLERPDRPSEERLLLCTDPDLPAPEVVTSYAKRWAVEPLFAAMNESMRNRGALTRRQHAPCWARCRWRTPGTSARTWPAACRRALGCGSAAAGGPRVASIASAAFSRTACRSLGPPCSRRKRSRSARRPGSARHS